MLKSLGYLEWVVYIVATVLPGIALNAVGWGYWYTIIPAIVASLLIATVLMRWLTRVAVRRRGLESARGEGPEEEAEDAVSRPDR